MFLLLPRCPIYLVFFLLTTSAINVEVTPGAYWKPMTQTITYEASLPHFYKSKWQPIKTNQAQLDTNFCNRATNAIPECVLLREFDNLFQLFDKDLNMLITNQNIRLTNYETTHHHIAKRGLSFVGDAFHWCCDVVTNRQLGDITTSENTIESQIQLLTKGLNTTFSKVFETSRAFTAYETEVNTNFEKIKDSTAMLNHYLSRLQAKLAKDKQAESGLTMAITESEIIIFHRVIQLTRVLREEQILSSCKQQHIPSNILNPETLSTDLAELTAQLKMTNHQLTIPERDILRYYQLPLCECKHTKDHIYLHLKIPITQNNKKWQLFELVTTPFTWNHQVCSIEQETTLLAIAQFKQAQEIRQLSGIALQNCRPHETKLCFLPRFSAHHLHGPSCAKLLYEGTTIDNLNSHCPLKCHTSSNAIIAEVNPDTFLITNLKPPVEIKCGKNTELVDSALLDHPGALKIAVPCSCSMYSEGQILIPPRFPCLTDAPSVTTITHVIPAAWSNLKSFIINPADYQRNPTFLNFSECLNPNWTLTVPFVNLTSHKDLIGNIIDNINNLRPSPQIPLMPVYRDSWFLLWNTVLSAVVLYLFIRHTGGVYGYIPPIAPVRATHNYDDVWVAIDLSLLWILIIITTGLSIYIVYRIYKMYSWKLRVGPPVTSDEAEMRSSNESYRLEVEEVRETEHGARVTGQLAEAIPI